MEVFSPRPTVDVVILNWNGAALLPGCLSALLRQDYPPHHIIMVDNGSTDDSIDRVREQFPQIDIIENQTNLGFAAGNNRALRESRADIIALVNPDVIVSPDWLGQLVNALTSDDQVGIAGSKLWYPDGQTIQHGGGFIRPPQAMPGHFGIGERDSGQVDEARDVDYVIGAALVLRRSMLTEIGPLDEGFFLYYEDVDLCERARRRGWQVVYTPSATAVHIESATAVKDSFAYLHQFHSGRWRFILKHYAASLILDETFPAEKEWLAAVDVKELMAAALAYQTMVTRWAEIMTARDKQGAGSLAADVADRLRSHIAGLRDVAMTGRDTRLTPTLLLSSPSPEDEVASAIRIMSQTSPAGRPIQPTTASADRAGAGLKDVLIALRTETASLHDSFRHLSELQASLAALQSETAQLAESRQDLQRLIDELEAHVAVLASSDSTGR